jgi:rod shape determining protein RodA
MFNLSNIKKVNHGFLLIIVLLCVVGALNVFSITYHFNNSVSNEFFDQFRFYLFGLLIFFALSTLNYRKLKHPLVITFIYCLTIILLVLVLIFGIDVFGTKRWLDLGIFMIQPSEFTKLTAILLLAWSLEPIKRLKTENLFDIYSSKIPKRTESLKSILKSDLFITLLISFVGVGILIGLVLMQKSLGNTLLIALTYLLTLFLAIPKSLKLVIYLLLFFISFLLSFFVLSSVAILASLITILLCLFLVFILTKVTKLNIYISLLVFILPLFSYPVFNFAYDHILQDYQRQRIETFLSPSSSQKLEEDWNRQQSLNAISSAQFFGKGLLKGSVVNSDYLPFAHTDFAFASFAEQFGFVGVCVILILYFALLFKISNVAGKCKDNFGIVICLGVGVMILLNVFQHVGMNLGILPITGVPLPLISLGGSNILTIFIGLGLVQAVEIWCEEEGDEVVKLIL